MKKKLKIIIPLLLLILGGLAFFLLSPKNEPTVDYLGEFIRRGDISKVVNTTGEIGAVLLVSVGAQVSGQIEILHVSLGDEVKKGDLIAEIDSTTQENDLNTSKARLETYQSQLKAKEVELKIAQTRYNREFKLKKRDAASENDLEDAENALASAKAGIDELKSLVKQTEIAVSTAEVNLGYTRILSPLDGTVVSVPVEEGQTVNANQTTPTIVQVADLSKMEIKMQISEGDVTQVKAGQRVTYTILSEPHKVFEGFLKSVDPGLTTLTDGNYTGSADSTSAVYYYGKVEVPNESGQLRIGMTTQNIITIADVKNVLMVPTIAIEEKGGRATVQVMERGRQVEKEITIGLSDNMNTEVIAGLLEGQEVVAGQMGASNPMGRRGPSGGLRM